MQNDCSFSLLDSDIRSDVAVLFFPNPRLFPLVDLLSDCKDTPISDIAYESIYVPIIGY